ncbi:MAG: RDD family protein [Clostridiales bacterium]|jgi:uncharacterized RDD family membrane protein YckC|nr:RDD family protein [Clostridiales bacterium]
MKTVTVITPANIEVEYRLAGVGSRLAAFIIDFLLQLLACIAVIGIVLFGIDGRSLYTITDASGFTLAFVVIACFVIQFGYFIVCEMLMNGQSVGKKVFSLRVIRDNGQPVGFTQSVVRGLFRTALDMMYIGLFSIFFSKKNKRLGDMAAGTVVVSEHYEKRGGFPMAAAFAESAGIYEIPPEFSHIKLTEEERRVVREYLRRGDSLPDYGEAVREKLAEYLANKWQIDANRINDETLKMLVTVS